MTVEQKKMQLKQLRDGDVVYVRGGKQVVFKKLNRTRFYALDGDQLYAYQIYSFEGVAEKQDAHSQLAEKEQEIRALRAGDWIYYYYKGDTHLVQFEAIADGRMVTRNPAMNQTVRVPFQYYAGRVVDLLMEAQ